MVNIYKCHHSTISAVKIVTDGFFFAQKLHVETYDVARKLHIDCAEGKLGRNRCCVL